MKKPNDYFVMMENLISYGGKAAELLITILTDFDPSKIQENRVKMHNLEHEADEARHLILNKLSREFITPIERDDILSLVQIIDDVTDSIDEVVINLYMFNITSLPTETMDMASLVVRCVKALEDAVKELHSFKKPEKLVKLLIEVNTVESIADEVYTEAMRALFTSAADTQTIIGIREIYECLESCCDLCEHAADIIENTIMKNS
ncbi:MAG: DUF47 family protein [Clostridiales bacterium]|nr:DUF47 family protein [Clostridiales bacterium]